MFAQSPACVLAPGCNDHSFQANHKTWQGTCTWESCVCWHCCHNVFQQPKLLPPTRGVCFQPLAPASKKGSHYKGYLDRRFVWVRIWTQNAQVLALHTVFEVEPTKPRSLHVCSHLPCLENQVPKECWLAITWPVMPRSHTCIISNMSIKALISEAANKGLRKWELWLAMQSRKNFRPTGCSVPEITPRFFWSVASAPPAKLIFGVAW